MDLATGLGIFVGLGAIIVGNVLEGGHTSALVQYTAGLIVFGGTLGATLVSHKMEDFKLGFRLLKYAFGGVDYNKRQDISNEIMDCSRIVRQDSMIGLEKKIKKVKDPYLKKVLRLLVDGVDAKKLEEICTHDIERQELVQMVGAKVWSDAGGFAPTIGILGAVLGLIHVMGNLTNTSELGKGIAVAFVATIYGVGSANLIFIPLANKIKRKIEQDSEEKLMILEGALSILSGDSSLVIQEKLASYGSNAFEQ